MRIGCAYVEFGGMKGVARAAAEVASRIAAAGHEVHFHCVKNNFDDPRIRIHHISGINSFNSIGLLSFAMMGRKSLKRFHYDVTHSHGNIVGSDIITAHSCHKAAMRVHSSRGVGAADHIRLHIERKNYGGRRFDKVIAVAEGVKRELMNEYDIPSADIAVIPNGVNLETFTPRIRETKGRAIRDRLGVLEQDVVLIFVANEFDRKGLEFVISAIHLLRQKNIKLLVLGEDASEPFEQQATALGVKHLVKFVGSVQDVEAYYVASDIFVLPSRYEAFSLATLEAAASGLPLVATRVNGTEELIQNGVNGFFVERDADDIGEKLQRLLNDATLRRQLGIAARHSAEHYSWDIIARRTLHVYEQIR